MRVSTKVNSAQDRSKAGSAFQSTSGKGKPAYQKVGSNSLKKIKFHSKSCEDASKQERIFHKLDPKNPQHARKLSQRRKQISYGKNTISYDMYCRKIPKERRQKRSMITPSTPDHTLDIPNKKWNGMVRSWRIALHRYDPVDLQKSFAAAQETAAKERKKATESTPKAMADMTTKEKEIAESGLMNLVQVTPSSVNGDGRDPASRQEIELLSSPPPTYKACDSTTTTTQRSTPYEISDDGHRSGDIISELNRWGAAREATEDEVFFSEGDDDDSDDDLL